MSTLGPEHPDVGTILGNLAWLQAAQNKPRDALALMRRALRIEERMMDEVFSAASERQKFAFLATVQWSDDVFFSLISQELFADSEAAAAGLDAALRRKGLVQETLARERSILGRTDNAEAARAAEELRSVLSQIATRTLAGPGEQAPRTYRQHLAKLEAQKEALEDELARLSAEYAAERAARQVDHRTVARLLPAGSALVEIVGYAPVNFKATGTENRFYDDRYLAFVLPAGAGAQATLIDLAAADAIDAAVQAFRREMAEASHAIAQLGEQPAEQRLAQKSRRIYELVFAPIENALGENQTLYLSPDGDLNLIPFGALQDHQGRYLAERYQFNYLTSGRDLVTFGEKQGQARGVTIVAAPDFSLSGLARLENVPQADNRMGGPFRSGSENQRSLDLKQAYWPPLPGAAQEADSIAQVFSHRNVSIYRGPEASEELFLQLPAPQILHLSTHGFFLTDEHESALRQAADDRGTVGWLTDRSLVSAPEVKIENPLLRSGLVLAGANRLGKESLPAGAQDGILTALEISGMNFWGTDLVVLSACETGLGETRRGEGVFGLRRAFQLAGAKTVIMSLWKVPDAETRQLMVDFYRRLQAGEGKAHALQQAGLALMRARRARTGAAHPLFWGAFVCVGDPE